MGMIWIGPRPRPDPCDNFMIRPVLSHEPVNPQPREFPRSLWVTDFLSLYYLGDFAKNEHWRQIQISPENRIPEAGSPSQTVELETLARMAKIERPTLMADILSQDGGFPYYFHLLGITETNHLDLTETSHPKTFMVLKIAARVGETAMVYFKHEYKRPRPSQIMPSLFPPLNFCHPSYPSGHSLVSHLMAYCAAEIRPEMRVLLIELANEIGRNREVAGLHFPSDTAAGIELAVKLFEIILNIPSIKEAIDDAKSEWGK